MHTNLRERVGIYFFLLGVFIFSIFLAALANGKGFWGEWFLAGAASLGFGYYMWNRYRVRIKVRRFRWLRAIFFGGSKNNKDKDDDDEGNE